MFIYLNVFIILININIVNIFVFVLFFVVGGRYLFLKLLFWFFVFGFFLFVFFVEFVIGGLFCLINNDDMVFKIFIVCFVFWFLLKVFVDYLNL